MLFWLLLGAVGVASVGVAAAVAVAAAAAAAAAAAVGVAVGVAGSRVGLRRLRRKAFSDPATQCSIVSSSLPRGVVRSKSRVMAARGAGESGCVDVSDAFNGSDVGLLSGCCCCCCTDVVDVDVVPSHFGPLKNSFKLIHLN